MLALLKPKYEITIMNKNYPKPEEGGFTPFFDGMAKALIGKHSLKTTKDMYPAFGERLKVFSSNFDQMRKFLSTIVCSNMVGNDSQAIAEKVAPFKQKLNALRFSPPPGLTAEVAILPADQQLTMLNSSISLSVQALTFFLTKGLDELVQAQQVGLIEWFSKTVVRFHFYLNSYESKETILNRIHTQNGQTHTETFERETTKIDRRQRHQHDLVDATEFKVDTEVPYRIERLVQEIPTDFRDFFRVVRGNQIFEHVVEDVESTVNSQSETSTWTEPPRSVWQRDPALVIGNYVVAGWGDEEEKRSRDMEKLLLRHSGGKRGTDFDFHMNDRLGLHW